MLKKTLWRKRGTRAQMCLWSSSLEVHRIREWSTSCGTRRLMICNVRRAPFSIREVELSQLDFSVLKVCYHTILQLEGICTCCQFVFHQHDVSIKVFFSLRTSLFDVLILLQIFTAAAVALRPDSRGVGEKRRPRWDRRDLEEGPFWMPTFAVQCAVFLG